MPHLFGSTTLLRAGLALAALAACSTAPAAPQAQSAEPPADIVCYAGAYALPGNEHLILSPTADREGNPRGLRTLFVRSGAQGVVARTPEGGWAVRAPNAAGEQQVWPVSFGACEETAIALTRPDGRTLSSSRLAVRTTETSFESRGVTLQGVLVLPPSGRADQVLVQVQGSNRTSAVSFGRWRYIWPAQDVGVLLYDRRGTGRSGGAFTVDFDVLAADAAAAIDRARALAPRGAEVGFFGTSQGAWIAPLAATRTRADFLLVGYGAAYGPLVEDREEVMRNLRDAGYGGDVLMRAREITDATALGMSTAFASGLTEIAAVKARYGGEPWFSAIRGEYTHLVLAAPTEQLPVLFQQMNDGTTWGYDPLPALRATANLPLLWVLGGEDDDAPSVATIEVLNGMRSELPRLQIAEFPTAEHEIEEFATVNGERVSIGYSPGYLPMLAHWVRTKRVDVRGTNAEVR